MKSCSRRIAARPRPLEETEPMAVEYLDTPVGLLRVEASEAGIRSLHFVFDDWLSPPHVSVEGPRRARRHIERLVRELRLYFRRRLRRFTVPLDLRGTPFQLRAWEELRRIPYGATISYGEQARRMGNPRAARAVGQANHANPVAIVVPCHRVIGSDGSLKGYMGPGIVLTEDVLVKEALLAFEKSGLWPGEGATCCRCEGRKGRRRG